MTQKEKDDITKKKNELMKEAKAKTTFNQHKSAELSHSFKHSLERSGKNS